MLRKEFCKGACALGAQFFLSGYGSQQNVSEWEYPFLINFALPENMDFQNYNISNYQADVVEKGLRKTWEIICKGLLIYGETDFINVDNLGELYEEGLALQNKNNKKASGQYYTPKDVALVMAEWFDKVDGKNICDVGCGVGNLLLAYLDFIGDKKSKELLSSGRLYLYDNDEIALWICVTSLAVRYGRDTITNIHIICNDFLDKGVILPENCKVISNPPYAAITTIPETWSKNTVILQTKELYSAFMAKIIEQSKSSVIITPYSFIGGEKFYPLRLILNEKSGFVVSFDNVPGMIFIGRKHGIFNSNTGNSVRAAITVVDGQKQTKGFMFSPLIRFKNSERQQLLKCKTLEGFLGTHYQVVNESNRAFVKCDRSLEKIYEVWTKLSDSKVAFHISSIGSFTLSMPNTCRYFTVASTAPLTRKGQITLNFSDEDVYWYVFCMINSSFVYWYWRMFDGGITFPKGLLLNMPLFYSRLNEDDKDFCRTISQEMIAKQKDFIIRKSNKGVQENVKYPRKYRDKINARFLKILGIEADAKIFDVVHSNMALEISV